MGGAHAEDVGGDGDVCWEGEVVVGYSQWHGQALFRLIAKQAFASTAMTEKWREGGRGRAGAGAGARQDQTKQAQGERKKDENHTAVHGMQRERHESAARTHLTASVPVGLWIMQEVLWLEPP